MNMGSVLGTSTPPIVIPVVMNGLFNSHNRTQIRFLNNININYHISDMIPAALPPRVAGNGLTRSLFIL